MESCVALNNIWLFLSLPGFAQFNSGIQFYILFCCTRLEEKHQDRVKKLQDEIEELRSLLSKMGKELLNVKSELEIQKEANNRSPTTTMKNLMERLKNQLALKEKQQKVSMIISHFFAIVNLGRGRVQSLTSFLIKYIMQRQTKPFYKP